MNNSRTILSFFLLCCIGFSSTTAQLSESLIDQPPVRPELTLLLDHSMDQKSEMTLERVVIAYRMAIYYEKQGVPELGLEEMTDTEAMLSEIQASQRSLEISQMVAEYYARNGESEKAKRIFKLVKEQELRLSHQPDRQKTIAGILFFLALISMMYWGRRAYMRR